MAKPKPILAVNIVPDNVYMLRTGRGHKAALSEQFTLVKIVCDKTEGWLRGHVRVDHFSTGSRYKAVAHAISLATGKSIQLEVERNNFSDSWQFSRGSYVYLLEADGETRQKIANEYRWRMDELLAEANRCSIIASNIEG